MSRYGGGAFDQEWRDQQILNRLHERWAKRNNERIIEWRVNKATMARLSELMALLSETEEGSEDYYTISEEINSLPGRPVDAGDDAFIWVIPTDTQH